MDNDPKGDNVHNDADGVAHTEKDAIAHVEGNGVGHTEKDGVAHVEGNGVAHAEKDSVAHAEKDSVAHMEGNSVAHCEKDSIGHVEKDGMGHVDKIDNRGLVASHAVYMPITVTVPKDAIVFPKGTITVEIQGSVFSKETEDRIGQVINILIGVAIGLVVLGVAFFAYQDYRNKQMQKKSDEQVKQMQEHTRDLVTALFSKKAGE
jgi:hypothetical protein